MFNLKGDDTTMDESPQTIEDVLKLAGQRGIELTAADIEAAHHMAAQRRVQLEAESTERDSGKRWSMWIEQFNRWYPKFLQAVIGFGEVLITLTQTFLIAFGVPAVLLMLLIVEQQRVYHGVSLFELSPELAQFSAVALVSLNLILELLISYIEQRAEWKEPTKNAFSFKIMGQWIEYMIGRSDSWQARPKSPAIRFRTVLRIVTFSILTLALAGSMQAVIRGTTGNWLEAIRRVIEDSTLLEAATWAGGLMFAIAAVLSAQALSQYVAVKVVEIVSIMQSNADDKPRRIAETAGVAGAALLYARLKDAQRTRRQIAAASPLAVPQSGTSGRVSVTGFDTNGQGVTSDGVLGAWGSGQTDGQESGQRSKIDTALDLLSNEPVLRRLTVRELEDRYPDIGRNTWATAKRRWAGK
jgi:hypothetical protein